MMKYLKKYIPQLAAVLLLAIGTVAATLYAPVLTGNAIDLLIGPDQVDFAGLPPILFRLAIVIVFTSLCQWMMSQVSNRIAYDASRRLRNAVFDKLHSLPVSAIDSTPHGDYMSRITTDVEQISDGLIMGFTHLFTGIITIAGTIAFMFSINVAITVVVIVITPLSMFVSSFVAKHSYRMFREQSVTRGSLTALTNETIGGLKTVQAFGYEDTARERFDEINAHLQDCSVRALFYSALTNPTTRFVNSLVYAAVGILGAMMAIRGSISVGQLSCFLNYANQYTKPFNEISGVIAELQSARASWQRVRELLEMEDEPADPAVPAEPIADRAGDVDFENISFSYDPNRPLIENLSLHAHKGERVAVVGPTGCGKTTLINLLMRFYEADSGRILVGGSDAALMERDRLRTSFGMVLQDTWLMDGTIYDNIAYGRPDAGRAEVEAAAKAAHAHSFITRLPGGYDTLISEDGALISQGQRQLICIARAMLCHPDMLILDEATSSIDTRTEILVQRAFTDMMKGRTSFIVAHRLSTIREADLILVMKAGHVVEMGRHEELLARKGFYYELYMSQYA